MVKFSKLYHKTKVCKTWGQSGVPVVLGRRGLAGGRVDGPGAAGQSASGGRGDQPPAEPDAPGLRVGDRGRERGAVSVPVLGSDAGAHLSAAGGAFHRVHADLPGLAPAAGELGRLAGPGAAGAGAGADPVSGGQSGDPGSGISGGPGGPGLGGAGGPGAGSGPGQPGGDDRGAVSGLLPAAAAEPAPVAGRRRTGPGLPAGDGIGGPVRSGSGAGAAAGGHGTGLAAGPWKAGAEAAPGGYGGGPAAAGAAVHGSAAHGADPAFDGSGPAGPGGGGGPGRTGGL